MIIELSGLPSKMIKWVEVSIVQTFHQSQSYPTDIWQDLPAPVDCVERQIVLGKSENKGKNIRS